MRKLDKNSNSSFLQKFEGKTQVITKNGLSQILAPEYKKLQKKTIRRGELFKCDPINNEKQTTPIYDLDSMFSAKSNKQNNPTKHRSKLFKTVHQPKKLQKTLYIPSIYQLPKIRNKSKQVHLLSKSSIQNQFLPYQVINKSSTQGFLQLNLSKDAQQQLKFFDFIQLKRKSQKSLKYDKMR